MFDGLNAWWEEKQARIKRNRALADQIQKETGVGAVNPLVIDQYLKNQLTTQKNKEIKVNNSIKYLAAAAIGAFIAIQQKGK